MFHCEASYCQIFSKNVVTIEKALEDELALTLKSTSFEKEREVLITGGIARPPQPMYFDSVGRNNSKEAMFGLHLVRSGCI